LGRGRKRGKKLSSLFLLPSGEKVRMRGMLKIQNVK